MCVFLGIIFSPFSLKFMANEIVVFGEGTIWRWRLCGIDVLLYYVLGGALLEKWWRSEEE